MTPTARRVAVAASFFQNVRSGDVSAAFFMISIAAFSGVGWP